MLLHRVAACEEQATGECQEDVRLHDGSCVPARRTLLGAPVRSGLQPADRDIGQDVRQLLIRMIRLVEERGGSSD